MWVKVFWILLDSIAAQRSFFTWFCCVVLLGCLFLSPNFCHWDANRRRHPWWWILEVSYLPTELCFWEVSTPTWEMGVLQQCHCWEKSLSPCHFNSTLQRVVVQPAPMLVGSCPIPFSLLAWRCYTGPTRAGKTLVSFSFQQEKMSFWCGWRESGWFSLAG